MRRLKIFWHGALAGTVECPDSFRPPITQAELDCFPSILIARSSSWLFEVRQGDLRLELRGEGSGEEVVIVASDKLGPGDLGCIVSFQPADDRPDLAPDETMQALAADVLKGLH